MSTPQQKERVPAHETGHPDEITNTIVGRVNVEQAPAAAKGTT